ncbi:MAG: prepilin-type N-terminal cleavage/methylation domain-containing protein, partial [Armatimonadota bacterium]
MRRMIRATRGFTLTELLVVIAITSILLGLR